MVEGLFLMDNACHSGATLVETCRAYAPDGGCRVCSDGYYWHKKTCVGCWTEYLTCTGGDRCSASWTHIMTVDGECKDEVVGCAIEISSDVGCASCLPGYFSKDRMCSLCNATFDRCSVCDGEVCTGCVSDHVLSGGCVPPLRRRRPLHGSRRLKVHQVRVLARADCKG